MEDKRGQGIFLGIVGVATLVVAIIGATFAWFSASVTGDNEVNITAFDFDVDLKIDDLTGNAKYDMIPLLPDGPTDTQVNPTYQLGSNKYLLAAVNNTAGKGVCVDENGYQVCTLIKATFTNDGAAAVSLTGELTATTNGFTNLKVVELAADQQGKYSVSGSILNAPAANAEPGLPLGTANVDITGSEDGNTTVKYFAIYLLDTNGDQKDEMGAKFVGKFKYTSTVGGSKLTGSFTIAG